MNKQAWIHKWKNCQRCPLHEKAKHHVLFRGTIPASLLLIGEAPGKTENKIGRPFIGRSGELLTTALLRLRVTSYCITNTICCIPLQENKEIEAEDLESLPIRPPSAEEIAACSPHISELIQLCQPQLVGLLGKKAEESFDRSLLPSDSQLVILRHPAYILRKGGVHSLEFKYFVKELDDALEKANIPHSSPFKIGV